MLKLSKQADYATLLMSRMASRPASLRNVTALADSTGVSAPMVSKTLKLLARAGLIESVRGAAGGYRLSRLPQAISVADIVNAVEGPIAVTECSGQHSACALQSHCQVRPHWQVINSAIQKSLSELNLAQLNQPAVEIRQQEFTGMPTNAH